MKTSKQIKTELDQVNTRLAELREMRSKLEINVKSLQNEFIKNKISLDDVQAQQSKLDTLNNSIKVLEGQQTEIQAAFEKALAGETRVNLLAQAKTNAIDAQSALNDYLKTRNEFNDVTAKLAAQMIDAVGLYRSNQKEYRRIIKQIEVNNPGEPINVGLEEEARAAVVSEYIPYPKLEFAEVIDLAGRLLANRRERGENKHRTGANV